CRGFAGQVLFFARGIQEPVKVDGDVTIYLFDDQGTPEEQGKPLQIFNFDSGSFQAFLTETNLGVAYQLFVPYTRSGNHRASCSIRTKLEPSGSSPVFSRMATVILPGLQSRQEPTQITQRRPTRSHEVGTNSSGIELASHETVASANSRFADTPSMETVVQPSLSELQQKDLKNRLEKAAEVAVDNNVVITNRRVSAAQLSRERRRHHPPEESDSHRIGAEPSVSSRHPLLDE
ncbi:MAG: hypothetical protein KDA80_23895, partial [Planctomycetaceae bacterium]|nr:hypothetical protein [Planctomycetaceae bacterium]